MEKHPLSSIYLAGQPGRVSGELNNHNTFHTTAVFLVHLNGEFACHGRASGSRRATRVAPGVVCKPPRQQALEDVGVVLSAKHPDSTTFLSPSMADHIMNRSVLIFV